MLKAKRRDESGAGNSAICSRSVSIFNEYIHKLIIGIDGGDIGGLSQVLILEEIAHRIKCDLGLDELPRLCDYFDMIGGVGMGS